VKTHAAADPLPGRRLQATWPNGIQRGAAMAAATPRHPLPVLARPIVDPTTASRSVPREFTRKSDTRIAASGWTDRDRCVDLPDTARR